MSKLPRRCCGATSISLPVLTFGSMRFDPQRLDEAAGRDLLALLFAAGADAVHSSHEYPFHEFFCHVLRSLGKPRVTHIVKLGEPHFDYPGFRPARMIAIVEAQLRALGAERLDIVQWLLRYQPLEDRFRLPLFEACRDEVAATAGKLIEEGKIGAVAVFPYTPAFAAAALPLAWCRGLVTYLNPAERECQRFLDGMAAAGRFCVAIRPLLAGRLADPGTREGDRFAAACEALGVAPEQRPAFAMRYPLMHPAVCSTVLSMTSRAHAEAALAAFAEARADAAAFARASACFADAGL